MLNISSEAMEMCHATIVQLSRSTDRSKCLRFERNSEDRLTLVFDNPRGSDSIIRHGGEAIFAVPEKMESLCANKTLSVDDHGKLVLS